MFTKRLERLIFTWHLLSDSLQLVIRHLPPSLTSTAFLELVSPLPEYDYYYFVEADKSFEQSFSRAYINFKDVDDIYVFRDKFDGYVFIDEKGMKYA